MTALSNRHPLTVMLGALAALGLAALLLTLLPSLVWVSAPNRITAAPDEVPVPRLEQNAFEDYKAVIDRPLFNPGRLKDPPPPNTATAAQLPSLGDYRVAGIVIAGTVKLALVERKATKQVVTLHPGDMLDGRHVDDINETGLTLSGTNGAEVLTMPKPSTGRWSIAAHHQ